MSTEQHTAAHIHRDDYGARMGMWLFLFTELILFGGMFLVYSVYRFTNQAEFHLAATELNTIIGTFNTAILLTSSLTMALSITAIQKDNKTLSVFFQLLTILLGLFFFIGLLYIVLGLFTTRLYIQEGAQRLNHDLAAYLVSHKFFIKIN